MGITGLLPFVQKSTRPANLKEFSGKTAAVDTYCWLHKGAFSCAERLVKGEKTDAYVNYCMKMTDLLIASGVRPILVFDGRHLPSKKLTEKKRKEQREINRQKAKQFLIEGKIQEARECYQRAVDVTSAMAHEVIKECRRKGIDYIVAPYEADAQLAYLAQCKLAEVIITEDSDLILFGCEKVLFKMDRAGFGNLYEKSRLGECFGHLADRFTHEKFRQMCILSGCDYLPSLPGIGLGKASKFFKLISNPDLRATLPKLPSYLKMPALTVDNQYIEDFLKAENTFRHQLVFCPIRNELVPLNPYDPSVDPTDMTYAGQQLPREQAFDIAVGNIDVNTGQKIDSYYPKDGKILKERATSGNTQDQKVKRKNDEGVRDNTPRRLGAFEVAERRSAQPTTPRTLARLPQRPSRPLTSVENIDAEYDKQESPRQQLEGNLSGSSGPSHDNKAMDTSLNNLNEVGNVFKVTPKRVVRSRFFSSPAASVSPKKKLAEWQIQLSEPVCDGGQVVLSKIPQNSASQGKFQWGSRLAPQDPAVTPVSKQVSTPFKRLRLSMSALESSKKASCVLGPTVGEHEKNFEVLEGGGSARRCGSFSQPEVSNLPENSFSKSPASNGGSVLKNTDDSQAVQHRKSLFEVLEEKRQSAQTPIPSSSPAKFKNPFAKASERPPTSDLIVPESDEEDPMPPAFRESSKLKQEFSSTERWQVTAAMADDLQESEESPIPKFKASCNSSEVQGNSSQDLDYPNSLEDDESPWPSRPTIKQDPSATEVIEESDDDDLMVTGTVIVRRPAETPKHLIVKPRIPPKPTKKALSRQRRLGLSKSVMKKDSKQQSLLESLAKFQFKKSCL
ncbi:exonuclease tos [Dermacentor variabilis]|uniref:exonuclease tos n=1 Tax=Dermacentor variabilis TaxID=34621 RepID=UPI003F5C6C65